MRLRLSEAELEADRRAALADRLAVGARLLGRDAVLCASGARWCHRHGVLLAQVFHADAVGFPGADAASAAITCHAEA
jgi:hypothetical protein